MSSDSFYGCSSLEGYTNEGGSWYFQKVLMQVNSDAVNYHVKDEIRLIGTGVFWDLKNLKSVVIPEGITSFCGRMFKDCSNLKTIVLPKSISNTNKELMSGCYPKVIYYNGTDKEFEKFVPMVSGLSIESTAKRYNDCHETKENENGTIYIYQLDDNDNATIVGFDSLEETNVVIPETVDGYPVVALGEYAFRYQDSLKEIVVPNSVKIIEKGAFSDSPNIEKISLPFIGRNRTVNATEESVFSYVFGGTVPATLKRVDVTDAEIIPYNSFDGCSDIEEIRIDTNARIYTDAFKGCKLLSNIYFNSNDVKFAKSGLFDDSDFIVIHGNTGSSVEVYAKEYDYDFEKINQIVPPCLTTSKVSIVSGKIVLNVKPNANIDDKLLHIALYNESNMMIDYMIIPNISGDSINVVFADNTNAKYAKVFVWYDLISLYAIKEAEKVELR